MRSFVRVAIVAIAVAHTVSCRQPPAIPSQIPPTIDDGWTTESPEQVGIDRRRLEAMTGSIHANPGFNVHAVLIQPIRANPPERLLLDYVIPALPPAPRSACPS